MDSIEHSNLAIVFILTIGLGLASLLAYVARRIGLPAILGYLLAGYVIGPYSPGYVANVAIAEQLAELGVLLMLFAVGLHFKLQDLISVKNVAIPGAILQTLVATLLTVMLVHFLGGNVEMGIILGLSVGVASTIVLVRILGDNHLLNAKEGHIAVGWLVVEDIMTVFILVLLPSVALIHSVDGVSLWHLLGLAGFVTFKFVVLALFMFTWGHRLVDFVLINVARLRSQELFGLTVLALMFVIASGSAFVFGTSIALGAFIAGMVIGKTKVRYQASVNALPLKDIFSVVFFLSVGMLFNPAAILNHYVLFLAILAIILLAKPLTAYGITRFFGYSFKVAFTVAISLAQIGEFSFILSEEAMNLNLLPDEGFDVLVAAALVSVSINPLLFQTIDYFNGLFSFSKEARETVSKMGLVKSPFQTKILIVGYGPIGRRVAQIAKNSGYRPVILETNVDTVTDLDESVDILFGEATEPMILKDAHIEEAAYLVVTIPDTQKTLSIIEAARHVQPYIEIIARVTYIHEVNQIQSMNVHFVCSEQETLTQFTSLVHKLFQKIPFGNNSDFTVKI